MTGRCQSDDPSKASGRVFASLRTRSSSIKRPSPQCACRRLLSPPPPPFWKVFTRRCCEGKQVFKESVKAPRRRHRRRARHAQHQVHPKSAPPSPPSQRRKGEAPPDRRRRSSVSIGPGERALVLEGVLPSHASKGGEEVARKGSMPVDPSLQLNVKGPCTSIFRN
jgi:hypothetical protein